MTAAAAVAAAALPSWTDVYKAIVGDSSSSSGRCAVAAAVACVRERVCGMNAVSQRIREETTGGGEEEKKKARKKISFPKGFKARGEKSRVKKK